MKLAAILVLVGLMVLAPIFLMPINKEGEEKVEGNVWQFSANTIDGETQSLKDYEGKVLLIVNVASKCGYTKHYKGLQELYLKYKDKGLEILAFPCNQFGNQEPGTNEEIKEFCSTNFNVTFPLFDKINVNGENAHPLYKYLKSVKSGLITDDIKWNFTKFLVNRQGIPVERFAHTTDPMSMAPAIEKLLN